MDSFYEQPRPALVQISRNEVPTVPVVPEVSLLFPNNTVVDPSLDSMYLTYTNWKNRNQKEVTTDNFVKQTSNLQLSESYSPKQVRFESPVLHKQLPNESVNVPLKRDESKPFEKIYMANVPDRHLDLSIIEPPKMLQSVCKENRSPNVNLGYNKPIINRQEENPRNKAYESYKKITEQHDHLTKDQIIDIYNYRRDDFDSNQPYLLRQNVTNLKTDNFLSDLLTKQNYQQETIKCNASIQTDYQEEPKNAIVESSENDEPTIKDLLKIIHQQNNQLLILQKQVATLLNTNENIKQIEQNPNRNFNYCTSTQLDSQQNMWKGIPFQKKGPLKQFSVDVMTSFEVAIRRQQNVNRLTKDMVNQPPKICEVTETNSSASNNVGNILDDIPKVNRKCDDSFKTGEVSLTFNEPVHVPQTCQSPENTIQIEMKDYSSDSDDDEGWSFYNNVRGQVNNILKQTGIQPKINSPLRTNQSSKKNTLNLKKKVREATIKHLKSIGVHVPDIEDTEDELDTSSRSDKNKSDISFMVKQLLMKYLPDEQLGKIACESVPKRSQQNDFMKKRPEFSFASVQYMQKYNLLAGVNGHETNKQNDMSSSLHREPTFERILDITAIRQQPKLL